MEQNRVGGNAASLLGEIFLPGASQYMAGNVGSGIVHSLLAMGASALLIGGGAAPVIGALAVLGIKLNSYSSATTGSNLLGLGTTGLLDFGATGPTSSTRPATTTEPTTTEEPMAELIIYTDINFGGLHTHIFESMADFTQLSLGGDGSGIGGNWNDKVSSFVIVSGTWQFFKNVNFDSQQGGNLGPGLYSFVQNFGIDNDSLSSVRLVG